MRTRDIKIGRQYETRKNGVVTVLDVVKDDKRYLIHARTGQTLQSLAALQDSRVVALKPADILREYVAPVVFVSTEVIKIEASELVSVVEVR